MDSPALVNTVQGHSDSVAAPGTSTLSLNHISTGSSTSHSISESTKNPLQKHAPVSSVAPDTTSSPLPSTTNGDSLKVTDTDTDFDSEQLEDSSQQQPSKNNCDRQRSDQEINPRLVRMPSELVGKTVSPFLKEHIPGLYAPFGKASMPLSPPPTNDTTIVRKKDPNSKFCYRHRPDSKCRRAADESKMGFIQSVSVSQQAQLVSCRSDNC
jgi:F-box/WD-40 domain protein MET30